MENTNALKSNQSSTFDLREFQRKNKEWEDRRRERINVKKVEVLAKVYAEVRAKPEIGEKTKRLVQKGGMYGKNVLKRFEEHDRISRQEKAEIKREVIQS